MSHLKYVAKNLPPPLPPPPLPRGKKGLSACQRQDSFILLKHQVFLNLESEQLGLCNRFNDNHFPVNLDNEANQKPEVSRETQVFRVQSKIGAPSGCFSSVVFCSPVTRWRTAYRHLKFIFLLCEKLDLKGTVL